MILHSIFVAASAVMLYAGCLHLLIGLRRGGDAKYTSFGITAILYAGLVASTIGQRSALTLEGVLWWLNLKIIFSLGGWISLIWFVRFYTGVTVRTVQWGLTAFFGACLAGHLFNPEGFFFSTPSLIRQPLPWGEVVSSVALSRSQIVIWLFVAFGAATVFFAMACVAQYRKGEHRPATVRS